MSLFLLLMFGISIHAPREGGDAVCCLAANCFTYFNPRPPRGGRPSYLRTVFSSKDFNPRPPRGGRRSIPAPASILFHVFQSTPPARGATLRVFVIAKHIVRFQSTPPARGATYRPIREAYANQFQSTPPARGATPPISRMPIVSNNFNPRPPRGGRLCFALVIRLIKGISIHAPREGGDCTPTSSKVYFYQFQSTPPARGATKHNR